MCFASRTVLICMYFRYWSFCIVFLAITIKFFYSVFCNYGIPQKTCCLGNRINNYLLHCAIVDSYIPFRRIFASILSIGANLTWQRVYLRKKRDGNVMNKNWHTLIDSWLKKKKKGKYNSSVNKILRYACTPIEYPMCYFISFIIIRSTPFSVHSNSSRIRHLCLLHHDLIVCFSFQLIYPSAVHSSFPNSIFIFNIVIYQCYSFVPRFVPLQPEHP